MYHLKYMNYNKLNQLADLYFESNKLTKSVIKERLLNIKK